MITGKSKIVEKAEVTANVKRVPMGAGGVQGLFSEVSGFAPEAKSYLTRGRPKDARWVHAKNRWVHAKKAAVMFFLSNFQIIQGHLNSHEKIDLVRRSGFPTNVPW